MPRKDPYEEEIDEKDAIIDRLTKQNQTLREGCKALKEKLDAVQGSDGPNREDGLLGLARYAWGCAECRVALLACVIFARLVLEGRYDKPLPMNIASGAMVLFLFCKWNQQEYRDDGFVQLLMKWVLFGGGLYLTWLAFWHVDLWSGLVILAFTLLTMSKFTQRLAEKVSALVERIMRVPACNWIKGWLV